MTDEEITAGLRALEARLEILEKAGFRGLGSLMPFEATPVTPLRLVGMRPVRLPLCACPPGTVCGNVACPYLPRIT